MGYEPEDEAVKKAKAQLEAFGKRNQQRFRIIGDLNLCMRTCTTPEVRLTLTEATRRAIAEIEKEKASLDSKLQKDLQQAAKKAAQAKKGKPQKGAGAKPPDIPGKQKSTKLKLKLEVDKFNKKFLPNDHSLWLDLSAKPLNEVPFVDYKKTLFMLRYGIKF